MTTGYVVNLDNGHNGFCVESLLGVTHCGETFDRDAVELETFTIDGRDGDHPHSQLCYECSKVDSVALRDSVRRQEVVAE
ncbi:uncharacterized protein NP_7068A (plasmid) [Natronomonas pharaonis DSM 2160]|uniref:Uncharacterized protein n=1 Tax=Natronomonas pharaonis (strain ATCC 35678 / DSM 2160 / CIP 103997 / JCM 8858 / NBRC 14720 / NCIMB 2260 / Gabara) TaxID=348780 RepID=Q3ILS1_NATPD|nr:hypothetical protein [Natronomonas pharaonis]CAI49713.1 uncharacterized protein NP_3244A [Natronomonas pharaonis DSM 2160]CAI50950.1 uncharacterized protein NP_7068A [Natronomonas pharaonis DSM 2160]